MANLRLRPIGRDKAFEFVDRLHRHHPSPQGWKFGTSVLVGEELVGVACAGRPTARAFDDGETLEVTRVCTDGTANACSKLYGSVRKAAFALGYRRVVTYTLATESGASLRAAGFIRLGVTRGHDADWTARPGRQLRATEPKVLWEARSG